MHQNVIVRLKLYHKSKFHDPTCEFTYDDPVIILHYQNDNNVHWTYFIGYTSTKNIYKKPCCIHNNQSHQYPKTMIILLKNMSDPQSDKYACIWKYSYNQCSKAILGENFKEITCYKIIYNAPNRGWFVAQGYGFRCVSTYTALFQFCRNFYFTKLLCSSCLFFVL